MDAIATAADHPPFFDRLLRDGTEINSYNNLTADWTCWVT